MPTSSIAESLLRRPDLRQDPPLHAGRPGSDARARTIVFVASSGGHLAQLRLISDRIPLADERRVWVTYDHVSARSSLDGQEFVAGFGPSTRSLRNAARNAALARRLYDEITPDVVISTGAGIAVPFLGLAAQRGIEAHYIESATRTDGPSLTGRILERATRNVSLHSQYRRSSRGRWHHCRNVFDDFAVDRIVKRENRNGLRILVTVGSRADFPFPALIDQVARLVGPEDEVIWQVGSTPAPPERPGHEVTSFIPHDRMTDLLLEADVVVSHAGVGISLSALLAGKRPILVPRRAVRAEVVDDHQVCLGQELADRGLAIVREADALRRSDLEEAANWSARRGVSFGRALAFPTPGIDLSGATFGAVGAAR